MNRSLFPLDYKLLAALDAVIAEQSFERAAQRLHLTQSAISQRIKQLEQTLAQPLLRRTSPLTPTPLGQQLLGHYRQVSQLERALQPWLQTDATETPLQVNIAVNADSLATWFVPALRTLLADHPIELNLLIQDENRTLDCLRQGEVFASISTQSHPLPGCHCDFLGIMPYRLVCTPEFAVRYFANGLHSTSLAHAPAVAFDTRDDMHVSYICEHFGLAGGSYPCHTVRSSEAFIALAEAGVAYCLIPELQIIDALQQGRLVSLPAPVLERTLYWHRWVLERGLHREISQAILQHAREHLPQHPTQGA